MNLEKEYEYVYSEAKRKWLEYKDHRNTYEDRKAYLILMKETLDSLAELNEESWKHDE